MPEYTPTTQQVRAEYVANRSLRVSTTTPVASEFDRWLADILATAWDTGWLAGKKHGYDDYPMSDYDKYSRESNPYRKASDD